MRDNSTTSTPLRKDNSVSSSSLDNTSAPQGIMPDEMWLHIFSFFDRKTLSAAAGVNRDFYRLSKDKHIKKVFYGTVNFFAAPAMQPFYEASKYMDPAPALDLDFNPLPPAICIHAYAIASNGQILAVSVNTQIVLFDNTGAVIETLNPDVADPLHCLYKNLAFTPDATRLIGMDIIRNTMTIYDATTRPFTLVREYQLPDAYCANQIKIDNFIDNDTFFLITDQSVMRYDFQQDQLDIIYHNEDEANSQRILLVQDDYMVAYDVINNAHVLTVSQLPSGELLSTIPISCPVDFAQRVPEKSHRFIVGGQSSTLIMCELNSDGHIQLINEFLTKATEISSVSFANKGLDMLVPEKILCLLVYGM